MTVSRLSPTFLVVIGALLAMAAPVAGQTTPTPAKPPTTKPAAAKPAVAKPAAAKPAAEAAPAGSDSPLADLKKANQQLKKSFGNKKPSWSPEAEAKNSEIRKIV